MKGKRVKKEENVKNKIGTIFTRIILIVLIAVLIYSGYKIIKWYMENEQSNMIMEKIKNTVTVDIVNEKEEYNIDFETLKNNNRDVIAWIKINGTNIEYPVVKGKDNDYYLTHSLDKSYNSVGWIFMDYKNKLDGTDKNIVIFGHNRKDGSMFGSLGNILTEEWQQNEENYIIVFYTPEIKKQYKVFSVYKVLNEEYYIKTQFGETEFDEFVKTIKNRSTKDFEEEVSENDNILTLSTCADNNKYRIVLHAKEI